jgi:hypothetical protein
MAGVERDVLALLLEPSRPASADAERAARDVCAMIAIELGTRRREAAGRFEERVAYSSREIAPRPEDDSARGEHDDGEPYANELGHSERLRASLRRPPFDALFAACATLR